MGPALSAIAFTTILATCAAGFIRAPWWWAVAGACLLTLISLNLHKNEYVRYARINDTLGQSTLVLSGVINASAAGAVAFALGRAIGWVWGI